MKCKGKVAPITRVRFVHLMLNCSEGSACYCYVEQRRSAWRSRLVHKAVWWGLLGPTSDTGSRVCCWSISTTTCQGHRHRGGSAGWWADGAHTLLETEKQITPQARFTPVTEHQKEPWMCYEQRQSCWLESLCWSKPLERDLLQVPTWPLTRWEHGLPLGTAFPWAAERSSLEATFRAVPAKWRQGKSTREGLQGGKQGCSREEDMVWRQMHEDERGLEGQKVQVWCGKWWRAEEGQAEYLCNA